MRVFLTGGTGFIGQSLTRRLLARGWTVVALVRRPDAPQARALAQMGAQCVVGDVTDRESMRASMEGCDLVVHNAAWYEIGVPKAAHRQMNMINVAGTDNVLGLALELGVRHTVFVSSTLAYGDTGSELRDETYNRQAGYRTYYEQTKTEAHELALDFQKRGLPLVIVCPANVVGPNDHAVLGWYLRLYINGLMTPFAWARDTILAPVHVDDVAEGIALAAEKGRPGETYILCGEPTMIGDIVAIWHTQPGGQRVRGWLPFWLAAPMMAPVGPLLRLMGLSAFASWEMVAASTVCCHFSNAKAQRELGWTCRPAGEMWLTIVAEERRLLARRTRRDLVSRLKPLDTALEDIPLA